MVAPPSASRALDRGVGFVVWFFGDFFGALTRGWWCGVSGDRARGVRAGRGSGSAAHLAHDGEAAETDTGLFLVGHGVHAETCEVRAGRGEAD